MWFLFYGMGYLNRRDLRLVELRRGNVIVGIRRRSCIYSLVILLVKDVSSRGRSLEYWLEGLVGIWFRGVSLSLNDRYGRRCVAKV